MKELEKDRVFKLNGDINGFFEQNPQLVVSSGEYKACTFTTGGEPLSEERSMVDARD